MISIYIVWMFLAGALIAMQAGVNAELARAFGHPVLAATISFLVGSAALLAATLALRSAWPAAPDLAGAPWWAWTGGVMGAIFVVSTVAAAPKLGAATLVSVAVAGQLTCALVLDHYGWAGFAERPVSPWRVMGVAILMLGAVMVRRC